MGNEDPQSDKLDQVRQILYKLLENEKPDALIEDFLQAASFLLNADAATIVLWEGELGFYNLIYNIPKEIPLQGMIIIPDQGGLDGRIYRENKHLEGKEGQKVKTTYLTNYSKNKDAYPQLKPAGFQFAMGLPLFVHRKLLATLCFYNNERTERMDANEEELLLEIGNQASIALLNAQIFHDLQEFKQQYDESRSFLDLLLNSSPDIIINTDLTGRVKFWNKAAEFHTQYPVNEIMNKKLPLVPGDNETRFYELFSDVRRGESFSNQTFELNARTDKKVRIMRLSFVPVRNQRDNIDSVLITGQDVSEREKLQNQVQQYNQELNEKDKALNSSQRQLKRIQDELMIAEKIATIGSLSDKLNHQINNPLMTIVTAGQFILDEVSHQITGGKNLELWYDFKDSLNSILTEGGKIKKVLKDLRLYSEVAKEEKYRPIDILDVLEQIITANKEIFVKNDIKVKKSVSKEIGDSFKIQGNYMQLKIVFNALISNAITAINHTPLKKGEIKFDISQIQLNKHPYIRFRIADSGIGMITDKIDYVFDPFYTDWDHEVVEIQHTGMGLTIARTILQNHHAFITVNSELEKGTEIFIDFPKPN